MFAFGDSQQAKYPFYPAYPVNISRNSREQIL